MPSQYHKKQHWTIKKTTQQRRGETNGGSKKGQGTARRLPEHRKKRVRLTLWLVNRKRIPFWSRMPDGHIEHEALSARTLHIQENLWPTRLLLDRLVRKKWSVNATQLETTKSVLQLLCQPSTYMQETRINDLHLEDVSGAWSASTKSFDGWRRMEFRDCLRETTLATH